MGSSRIPGKCGAHLHREPGPRDGASGDPVPARGAYRRLPTAAPSSQETPRFDSYDDRSYDYHSDNQHD
ncbi:MULTISPECIES: hypothetical protein [unclassified Streptomyces]|uniref:hypothetical protein n=1 Tax=unclassified Streptomyces TaxID=2593676 RepID=UPI00114D181E|nr:MULTISPECIES: hypothetical protein [unclassified Streptomyces]